MKDTRSYIKQYLAKNKALFQRISEYIYQHPETRFEEYESSRFLASECEQEGFIVERGVADMETAFVATYGSGSPIIGFLGEFDALSGLGQEPNETEYKPVKVDVGHGCGHNLLGTGSLAAAFAVKSYIEANGLSGTVKFFGCPGEEGGSGKTFMVREGVFDEVDAALTWHPSPANAIMSLSSLANYQIAFKFKGIPSHAANSPHLGRSALDAVELMNVGVNYLREHIIPEARLHYAVTNTGGISPNVVQANAEVLYLIRAPKVTQVDEIYQRVCEIAEGAAKMTGTELGINFDKACSNYIPNRKLESLLYNHMQELGIEQPTDKEKAFAEKIWSSLTDVEKGGYLEVIKGFGYGGDGSEFAGKYLSDSIAEYEPTEGILPGSTDVSDVSWVVPTAQLTASTSALGTPLHTWQMTSQGISSYAHKGMLRAAGAMALTSLQLLLNPSELIEVKQEFHAFREKHPYRCPIPNHVQPSKLEEG
ncbi:MULTISPECIES: M20 family metallopeptidase [Virgibacillus]|uniref:M20 family metallopeptidase n=1 Tax=Virgibacillus TaxID=84406 RepID=UPI0003889C06|nr:MULTISPECIES: M20 family metallopeptidase [Virgibacillus]EQB37943.1 peptidase M20 [Virgibacillus sp. CM-4]MYL40649.1 amidohydrolase [Virgibacillus massiliensis]